MRAILLDRDGVHPDEADRIADLATARPLSSCLTALGLDQVRRPQSAGYRRRLS